MKSLLLLSRIKVENANAISGLVYGFPSITHFLGYVHALSRELEKTLGICLGGCSVVCHDYHVHSYAKGAGGEQVFALTKNPLTKEEEAPPFNEEGKVGLTVSLIIECNFTADDFPAHFTGISTQTDMKKFEKYVANLATSRRLAGGPIVDISTVQYFEVPESEEKEKQLFRRILRSILPGFILKERADLLSQYLSQNPGVNPFDGFLDFYTLKSKAFLKNDETSAQDKVEWENIPKPSTGWIVPIQVGYKAISQVHEKGTVARARDSEVPFCFVEPVYGLAEWISPHRIRDIESIIWRYNHENDYYLCQNINKKIQEKL